MANVFTLETDLKPLESIYKKHFVDISPREQCLTFRSLLHSVEVVLKPEKCIPIVDALSRGSPSTDDMDKIKLPIISVHEVTHHIPVSTKHRELFQEEASKDVTLLKAQRCCLQCITTEKTTFGT